MTTYLTRTSPWLALLVLLCGGCYRATFYSQPQSIPAETHEEWTDFFLFGLVGHERFDVHQFCGPREAAEVRTGGNFATGLVTALTIGIYAPRKVYVTCSAGNAAVATRALQLDLDASGRPVRAVVSQRGTSQVAQLRRTSEDSYRVSYARRGAP